MTNNAIQHKAIKHAIQPTTLINRNRILRGGLLLATAWLIAACGANSTPTPAATVTVPPPPPTLSDELAIGLGPTMTPPSGRMADLKGFVPSDVGLVGRTGRPQLLVFYTAACGEVCERIRLPIFELQDKFGQFADFLYIDANGDAASAMRNKLNIREFPTLIALGDNGLENGRLAAELRADDLRGLLEQFLIDKLLTVG